MLWRIDGAIVGKRMTWRDTVCRRGLAIMRAANRSMRAEVLTVSFNSVNGRATVMTQGVGVLMVMVSWARLQWIVALTNETTQQWASTSVTTGGVLVESWTTRHKERWRSHVATAT